MRAISMIIVLAATCCAASAQPADVVANPISLVNGSMDLGESCWVEGETCGSCDAHICCCPSNGLYAGVEATYLYINPTQNRAAFDDFDGMGDDTLGDPSFDYGFEAAPRVWLGYELGNCWGIRGRYWQFDAEDNVALQDGPDHFGFFNSEFEAYTVDLEFTRRTHMGCHDLLLSVGARHAAIEHQYAAQIVELPNEFESLLVGRRIQGTGVTAAIEGWRPIGCSSVSLFWSARGSVLWGDNNAHVLQVETDGARSAALRDSDEMLVAEAQLGLQWSRAIECLGGAELFLRGAFEYQVWDLNSEQLVIPGLDADDDPLRVDALGRGDVNFYGVAFTVGILR